MISEGSCGTEEL